VLEVADEEQQCFSWEFHHDDESVVVLQGQKADTPTSGVGDGCFFWPSDGHPQPPGHYAILEALWLQRSVVPASPSQVVSSPTTSRLIVLRCRIVVEKGQDPIVFSGFSSKVLCKMQGLDCNFYVS
jgi:hypothetical protein